MWITTKQKNNYVLTLRRRLQNLENAFGVHSDAYQSYEANLYTAFGRNAVYKDVSGTIHIITKNISNETMANNIKWLLARTPTVSDIIRSYRNAYSKEPPEIRGKYTLKEYAKMMERASGDLTTILYRYYELFSTRLPKAIDYLHNAHNSRTEINNALGYLKRLINGNVNPDDYKNL